jgi:hypothetical protein
MINNKIIIKTTDADKQFQEFQWIQYKNSVWYSITNS